MSDTIDKEIKVPDAPVTAIQDASSEEGMTIHIDPEKEAAALRKFDRWLVPVAFAFLVLSSLDRNNVRSDAFPLPPCPVTAASWHLTY
jgi:hypothetical protein